MKGIVVGVDGSEASVRALDWAAAEARLRDAPLAIVLAWQWPTGFYADAGWAGVTPELESDLRQSAEERLDEACSAADAALDGLSVRREVVEGAAAQVLLDAAKDADLLVVGTRGRGGFAGLLLGSVSQQCAHHSPCPLVVVPHANQ